MFFQVFKSKCWISVCLFSIFSRSLVSIRQTLKASLSRSGWHKQEWTFRVSVLFTVLSISDSCWQDMLRSLHHVSLFTIQFNSFAYYSPGKIRIKSKLYKSSVTFSCPGEEQINSMFLGFVVLFWCRGPKIRLVSIWCIEFTEKALPPLCMNIREKFSVLALSGNFMAEPSHPIV